MGNKSLFMSQSAEKIQELKTALHSFHLSNGGKMVPFAGYEMPVQYLEGIMNEHKHVRSVSYTHLTLPTNREV